MTKAAPKSDVNNSAFFIMQPVEKLLIKRVCKGEPLRPSRTFISINNFFPLADDLQAPGTGCFWLTVPCTVSETCRVCDAVMDTLKKITPSRFSTLPTLCWKEKGIRTSPRITSKRSCLSMRQLHFPTYNFCCWRSSERTLSVTAEKWPKHRLCTFLSNISRKKNPSLKHFSVAVSVPCQAHIWPYIVVGWSGRVVLWLVPQSFSQTTRAQFPLTAKVQPTDVPFS